MYEYTNERKNVVPTTFVGRKRPTKNASHATSLLTSSLIEQVLQKASSSAPNNPYVTEQKFSQLADLEDDSIGKQARSWFIK